MSDHEKRRIDDNPVAQLIKNWQFYSSIAILIFSLGGYVATIRYLSDHLKDHEKHFEKIDNWISSQANAAEERNKIMATLTALQGITEKRLERLENWRDEKHG